jgi:hypothetical protein
VIEYAKETVVAADFRLASWITLVLARDVLEHAFYKLVDSGVGFDQFLELLQDWLQCRSTAVGVIYDITEPFLAKVVIRWHPMPNAGDHQTVLVLVRERKTYG